MNVKPWIMNHKTHQRIFDSKIVYQATQAELERLRKCENLQGTRIERSLSALEDAQSRLLDSEKREKDLQGQHELLMERYTKCIRELRKEKSLSRQSSPVSPSVRGRSYTTVLERHYGSPAKGSLHEGHQKGKPMLAFGTRALHEVGKHADLEALRFVDGASSGDNRVSYEDELMAALVGREGRGVGEEHGEGTSAKARQKDAEKRHWESARVVGSTSGSRSGIKEREEGRKSRSPSSSRSPKRVTSREMGAKGMKAYALEMNVRDMEGTHRDHPVEDTSVWEPESSHLEASGDYLSYDEIREAEASKGPDRDVEDEVFEDEVFEAEGKARINDGHATLKHIKNTSKHERSRASGRRRGHKTPFSKKKSSNKHDEQNAHQNGDLPSCVGSMKLGPGEVYIPPYSGDDMTTSEDDLSSDGGELSARDGLEVSLTDLAWDLSYIGASSFSPRGPKEFGSKRDSRGPSSLKTSGSGISTEPASRHVLWSVALEIACLFLLVFKFLIFTVLPSLPAMVTKIPHVLKELKRGWQDVSVLPGTMGLTTMAVFFTLVNWAVS